MAEKSDEAAGERPDFVLDGMRYDRDLKMRKKEPRVFKLTAEELRRLRDPDYIPPEELKKRAEEEQDFKVDAEIYANELARTKFKPTFSVPIVPDNDEEMRRMRREATTIMKKKKAKPGSLGYDADTSEVAKPLSFKHVASRIDSLSNAKHKPGGGNVQIIDKPMDLSSSLSRIDMGASREQTTLSQSLAPNDKRQLGRTGKKGHFSGVKPRIDSRREDYVPKGGDVKVVMGVVKKEKRQYSFLPPIIRPPPPPPKPKYTHRALKARKHQPRTPHEQASPQQQLQHGGQHSAPMSPGAGEEPMSPGREEYVPSSSYVPLSIPVLQDLKQALGGSDAVRTVRTVASVSPEERGSLPSQYRERFGVSVEEDIFRSVDGLAREMLLLLTAGPEHGIARLLAAPIAAGNTHAIAMVLAAAPGAYLARARDAYYKDTGRDMDKDVLLAVPGDPGRILHALIRDCDGGSSDGADGVQRYADLAQTARDGAADSIRVVLDALLAPSSVPVWDRLQAIDAALQGSSETSEGLLDVLDGSVSDDTLDLIRTLLRTAQLQVSSCVDRAWSLVHGGGGDARDILCALFMLDITSMGYSRRAYASVYKTELLADVRASLRNDRNLDIFTALVDH